ncbi:MAG: hypothetical protein NZM43_11235 [Saprospiraceae bacterium]|nr:hypothetical protein [Saprospiraceae bacterium]MDW8484881.1 hypothetical protein [Saprospiraceae bacterium]
MLYAVKYTGPFGYIKPWTAVRDKETYSQQFLTPSIVEGMEKKLFPELLDATRYPYGKIYKIKRHRLNYIGLSEQQERTQSKGISLTVVDKRKFPSRELSILKRNVMVEPHLYLAFTEKEDAEHAFAQHICLCRNEDILMPEEFLEFSDEADFDKIEGFELLFCSEAEGFKVGHNRFAFGEAMYGELKIFGNPIRQPENYF